MNMILFCVFASELSLSLSHSSNARPAGHHPHSEKQDDKDKASPAPPPSPVPGTFPSLLFFPSTHPPDSGANTPHHSPSRSRPFPPPTEDTIRTGARRGPSAPQHTSFTPLPQHAYHFIQSLPPPLLSTSCAAPSDLPMFLLLQLLLLPKTGLECPQ